MKNRIKSDWLLYLVWSLVFVLVVVFTLTHQLESTSFFGITDTREIIVSSENSIEIERIYVAEGQAIDRGQKLVELVSPELTIKINQISHQLSELKAQKGVDRNELVARIHQLNAEKESLISDISSKIRQLENQYNINRELTSELKSIPKVENTGEFNASNPINLEIENLKKELTTRTSPIDIQIDLLLGMLDASESPIKIQVERLEKELELLKQEEENLTICAQISGIIGSVNFKTGEKVAPHNPILTLHTKNPSIIKGYIFEDVYTQVSVGMEVRIIPLTKSKTDIKGTVIGVGSRIVEYPVRLRKHPDIQLWGREIIIRIPTLNPLILGEKVLISIPEPIPLFAGITRDAIGSVLENYNIRAIQSLKTGNIEASAMLYLPDMKRYLVLSDDTPGNKPLLFLMDNQAKITDEITIDGLDEIDDMESIVAGDGETIYIASSLSINKHGERKPSRRSIIRLGKNDSGFTLTGCIDLFGALERCIDKSDSKDWAQFIREAISNNTIDIEGMFYLDGDLYLGFKSPLRQEKSVILKIDHIEDLFAKGELINGQVSIWKSLRLHDETLTCQELLSDMYYGNNTLFVSSTADSASETGGSIWRLDLDSGEMKRIASFKNLKPEGIAATNDRNTLAICFDQGSHNPSQFGIIEVTP